MHYTSISHVSNALLVLLVTFGLATPGSADESPSYYPEETLDALTQWVETLDSGRSARNDDSYRDEGDFDNDWGFYFEDGDFYDDAGIEASVSADPYNDNYDYVADLYDDIDYDAEVFDYDYDYGVEEDAFDVPDDNYDWFTERRGPE